MTKHDSRTDDFLHQDNLRIDPKFEKKLLKSLKDREKHLQKQSNARKVMLGIFSTLGVSAAAIALVVLFASPTGPGDQPVALAQDVFEQVQQQPIGTTDLAETITQTDAEGQFIHRQNTMTYGPGYNQCTFGSNLDAFLDQSALDEQAVTTDTYVYTKGDELEVYYEKVTSQKSPESIMFYDTDTSFKRIDTLIGDEQNQFEYLKNSGRIVDQEGNDLPQDAQLTTENYNNQTVYKLFIAGVNLVACQDDQPEQVVEIVLSTDDFTILETNAYLDDISPEAAISSAKTTVTKSLGDFESFEQIFADAGFDQDLAKGNAGELESEQPNASEQPGANQETLPGTDATAEISTTLGSFTQTPVGPNDTSYSISFSERDDLSIYVYDGSLEEAPGLLVPFIHGFETRTNENDETTYHDVWLKNSAARNPDIAIDDRITADSIEGISISGRAGLVITQDATQLEAVTAQKAVYTVINTGNPDYPAIVIVESAETHEAFKDNWQRFIESIVF